MSKDPYVMFKASQVCSTFRSVHRCDEIEAYGNKSKPKAVKNTWYIQSRRPSWLVVYFLIQQIQITDTDSQAYDGSAHFNFITGMMALQ